MRAWRRPAGRRRRGSGAVGASAVQLARHFGADVTSVCRGANLELVRSLGTATAIDYTTDDFTQTKRPYDVIFDAVGKRKSPATLRQISRTLAQGGICISVDDGTPKLLARDLALLNELAETKAIKPSSTGATSWNRWPRRTGTSTAGTRKATSS